MIEELDELVNVREAAEMLGVSSQAWHRRVKTDPNIPKPAAVIRSAKTFGKPAALYRVADVKAYIAGSPARATVARGAQPLASLDALVRGTSPGAWFGGVCR